MRMRRMIICGLIVLLMVCIVPVSGLDWTWSTDGWSGWSHTASWSGTEVGPNYEYGPFMVNGYGEHGSYVNLDGGTTSASVEHTFTDPNGIGWNSVTFKGKMTGSDVPSGRWMTIEVNGQQVFSGSATSFPPGNSAQDFEIQRSFPLSDTVTIKISHGQNPAWRVYFLMNYDSVKLSTSGRTGPVEFYNNENCAQIGCSGLQYKIEGNSIETQVGGPVRYSNSDGFWVDVTVQPYDPTNPSFDPDGDRKLVTWTSNWPVSAVITKVGGGTHVFAYRYDGDTSDSSGSHYGGVEIPPNKNTYGEISHLAFCYESNIPTPEFPSTILPVVMIVGFLGAVLLIQRTREN